MPKKAGAKDTRKTIALEKAVIANFLMPWLSRDVPDGKRCCIQGCTHMANGQPTIKSFEQPCSNTNSSSIYDEAKYQRYHDEESTVDPYIGIACPCCTDKILDQPDT